MWAWALLPVIFAVFGMLGTWTVFGLAVSNETVNLTVEFPYISTCGTYKPQSCLFSQICNICSVLALWIVIIRFQQVRDLNCASCVNKTSLIVGFISSIGISILGNFQQSVVMGAHLLGAILAFFMGLTYFWLQVWLTYRAEPSHDKKWAGPARIIFCSLCTCLVVSMTVLHNVGYRSAAAMCEWALVMCFFILFAIFSAEFRHIDFHELHVQKEGLSKSSPEFSTLENNMVDNQPKVWEVVPLRELELRRDAMGTLLVKPRSEACVESAQWGRNTLSDDFTNQEVQKEPSNHTKIVRKAS